MYDLFAKVIKFYIEILFYNIDTRWVGFAAPRGWWFRGGGILCTSVTIVAFHDNFNGENWP